MKQVEILNGGSADSEIGSTFRPKFIKPATYRAGDAIPGYRVNSAGQIVGNSRLDSREWTLLDTEVRAMQRTILIGIDHLRTRGLVRSIGSLGVMQVDKRIQSERRTADVTMDTRTRINNDRVDRETLSVPLPVISTAYQIGERELEASRRLMLPLDTAEAVESSRAVSETLEGILFNGTTAVTLNGNAVKGYNNATGALSTSTGSLSTGAWTTGDNAYNTIKALLAQMELRRYRGPFMLYLHSTDYFNLLQLRASPSDTTQMDLIKALPGIAGIEKVDAGNATAGTALMVQMTSDVVQLQETMPITNREWRSDDQSTFYGKVMTVSIPFIQKNYAGYAGVALCSGC